MTTFGVFNGIVQIVCFARMHRWLGTRMLYLIGLSGFVLQFGMFAMINFLARNNIGGIGDKNPMIWTAIALQILGNIMSEMAYGCILIFISAAAPNRRMLGATIGLAKTVVSVTRAIGPALINSLFSLSIQKNILGGHGYIVYIIQFLLVLAMFYAAFFFPKEPWINGQESKHDSD